ncbi:MAG: CARDB domain-containing protein [Candidatus Thorarchaeota archaeon]
MKKKPYLLLSVFVFIFILSNFVSSLPAIPRSTSNPSDFVVEEQGPPESIDFRQQVEDDNIGRMQSKKTVDAKTEFLPSATDPTAGVFDYSTMTLPYNWDDATGGTWNDLSMSDSVMLELPFEFPFYGENFTKVYVSRHGWMSFYNTNPYQSWIWPGSSDESSWYAVAPYATPIDWQYGNPGVYNLSLSSPNRYVIEYNNVMSLYYPGLLVGTFQVIFYDNGTIDFNYDLIENPYDFPYFIGLNHGAISSNYEQHYISSFPVDDLTLRFDPPKKWLLITSDDKSASTDYNLTWEGHSNETIVVYHVFLNYAWYATTPLDYWVLTGLSTGYNWIEVYMETGGTNYTTGVLVLIDTDDPSVTIAYPSDMSTLNDGKINWTYSDLTSHVEYFEVYVNNSFHERVDFNNLIYLVLENQRWYNVTVVAYDPLGHSGSDNVTFYYDRTVPAAGFITTHNENPMWDIRDLYSSRGYLTGLITDSLTLDNLTLYDVIFIGDGGSSWSTPDITALEDFVNGGGKLVVSFSYAFPEGLNVFMANLGITFTPYIDSPAGNTTIFESGHPLMTGVTQLQHFEIGDTFVLSYPVQELIRSSDDQNIIGAVREVGESKVLSVVSALTWDLYRTDNHLMFENIIDYWLTLPLHDLSSSIDSPAGAGGGAMVDVYTYVTNQGSSTESGFTLELWVDGSLEDSLFVTSLDTGESASIHSQVLMPISGTMNLTSYVAPVIGESLVYNNREEKILAVYRITIHTPTTDQQFRGGLVFVNYSASDAVNLENITVFVNDAWITHVIGVNEYPDLAVFVPVFQNGTNKITLMGTWRDSVQVNESVIIESYLVVPRIRPTIGDYIFIDLHDPGYNIQMIFNFTFLDWLSPLEINCSMILNQTIIGMPSSYIDTWIRVNVLNGYISDGWPGVPLEQSWVSKHMLIVPSISVPEILPYSTFIDENSFPAANIGDPACLIEWNQVLHVISTGELNGYATYNLTIDLGTMNMNVTVLQCSGLFVYINQGGILKGAAVTNMFPPIDRPPLISNLDDFYIEYGTMDSNLTWYVSGNNPNGYTLYEDEVPIASGDWYIGVPFVVDLDGLSLGAHNYTLQLWDSNGEWSRDVVWVYVQDTTSPTINTPADIYYDEGDTGYSITWSPSDLLPSSYVVYMEGSVLKSGAWNSSAESILVSVDGLAYGAYNYTIVVTDTIGHSAVDQVWVNVQDGTTPTIDHPADFDYDEGETGNAITWTPDDLHPKNFTIYKDGTVEDSGSWDGSGITIDVDGLSPGVYNYTIMVFDLGENNVTDTVIVTVNEVVITTTTTTTPTTTPTGVVELPPEIMILIVGGLGGAVVIIIIVILLRRRGG